MRLIVEIASSIASDIRATLPADDNEAGVFLAGMCWAFLLFILSLLVVSYLALRLHGQTP